MKVRLWSDIHREIGMMRVNRRQDDCETVLVIAGDFDVGLASRSWLEMAVKQFYAVIYVPGNHEYYGNTIQSIDRRFTDMAAGIDNFHFLNPGTVYIDNVRFIGCTLWTDMRDGHPMIMERLRVCMNDYRQIKFDADGIDRVLRPSDIFDINQGHRSYIEEKLSEPWEGKTVVVTHHAPTFDSIHADYRRNASDDEINHGYANTGLERLFEDKDFHFWFHGHIHNWSETELHGKRIIARPRGYRGYEEIAKLYEIKKMDAEVIEV